MTSPPGGGCAGRRPAGRLQDTTRGRQLDERPWYTGFFDDDYLRIFGPVLAEERTAGEVNGVVELLGLAPGAGVLDLARAQGQRVGLVEADMRRLPFADGSFDAVVNLFHAFGYLEDEAQDELVLAEVARVLAPGGCFLQEVANREALVRGWRDSEVARHDDGLLVLQERALDLRTSRDVVRYTLVDADGPRATREASIRLYTLTELEAMLGRAGLELLEVFGDLDAGPLELDSSFVVTLSGRAGKGIS